MTFYDSGLIDYRDIDQKGIVGVSRPLYEETLNEIFKHINGSYKLRQFKELIPSNVIYCNNETNTLVWYKPKGVYKLNHTDQKWTGDYYLPKHLFVIANNNLSVACIKSRDKLTMQTELYLMPLPNITNERICMGSAKINVQSFKYWEDVIEEAEQAFYHSKFSHVPTKYIKKAFKANDFLDEDLISIDQTLEEIL